MAKSVNKVILIGHLGKDPEIRYTPSNLAVANFSLATNERFKDKDGNWADRTEWHSIVCFERLAEVAQNYLKKGGQVYIEGKIQTRSWDDKNTGEKKYRTEIVANDLVLLGGRPQGAGTEEGGGYQRSRTAAAPANNSANNFDQRTPQQDNAGPASTEITDADIPF